jgi:hypothetical protein
VVDFICLADAIFQLFCVLDLWRMSFLGITPVGYASFKKTDYIGDYYRFFDEDKSHNKTQKGVCYQYRVKY